MIFWLVLATVVVLSIAIAISERDGFFQALGNFFLGILFLGLIGFVLLGIITFISGAFASAKVLDEYDVEGSVVLSEGSYYADTGTAIPEVSELNAEPTSGASKVYRVQKLDNSGVVVPWDNILNDPYYTLEYNPDDLEIRE